MLSWIARSAGSETPASLDLRAYTHLIWFVLLIVAGALFCGGCAQPTRAEWTELAYPSAEADASYRTYRVDDVSPGGIRYQGDLDGDLVDNVVERVNGCLRNGPDRIDPQPVAAHALCLLREIDLPAPNGFVLVLGASRIAEHSGELVLEDGTLSDWDSRACETKGLPAEGCAWRALFREAADGTALLVVADPDLHMLPDVLTRWATQCRNPWAPDFPMQACASPAMAATNRTVQQ